MTYTEDLPKLFSFATSQLKDEKLIETLMKPLWKDTPQQAVPPKKSEVSQNWLHLIYYTSFDSTIRTRVNMMVNLFVRKTIAITAILQSQSMVDLPSKEFGENIVKNFCKYFSQNIEDVRLRGERSMPFQSLYDITSSSKQGKLDSPRN